MHVEDLLKLESLDLVPLWSQQPLLQREVAGVTATDLEDPTGFVRSGDVVLSGLVWWGAAEQRARADRFVTALRAAGVAALLAGEVTHGAVPQTLIESCREQGVVLLAVPAHVNFRAIIEAVHLRQWGELSRGPAAHHALPSGVRGELSRLLAAGTDPGQLLERAFAHLGSPACTLRTATGRTVATTGGAAARRHPRDSAAEPVDAADGSVVRVDAETSPYDAWQLHLSGEPVPPRALREIADILAQYRHSRTPQEQAARRAAAELAALVEETGSSPDGAALRAALRTCQLPAQGPYLVLAAALGPGPQAASGAADALTEALRHCTGRPFTVAERPGAAAVAVLAAGPDHGAAGSEHGAAGTDSEGEWDLTDLTALREVWPVLHSCAPRTPLHGAAGTVVPGPEQLNSSLVQARYALGVSRSLAPDTARLTTAAELDTLETLLAGVPEEVRAAYRSHTLGPLADGGSASHRMLRQTLEVFLDHSASWVRTAKALHLHVNTVHYRIQRVESLTGRDLSRLDHKLDLWAALRCR